MVAIGTLYLLLWDQEAVPPLKVSSQPEGPTQCTPPFSAVAYRAFQQLKRTVPRKRVPGKRARGWGRKKKKTHLQAAPSQLTRIDVQVAFVIGADIGLACGATQNCERER